MITPKKEKSLYTVSWRKSAALPFGQIFGNLSGKSDAEATRFSPGTTTGGI